MSASPPHLPGPRRPGAALARTGVLALALVSTAALAQSGSDPTPPNPSLGGEGGLPHAEQRLNERQWRERVEGWTLDYYYGDFLVGREYYPEGGGDRVIFIYNDGRCFDSYWYYQAQRFCFVYDGEHCFHHLERDGVLIAQEMDGDEQVVRRVSNEPLACTDGFVS